MSDYANGGYIPGEPAHYVSLGRCPLDGYQLIDNDREPEHVIPPAEAANIADVQRRIAEAHASEVTAEAEAITRDARG
ncbi:hypothetical protein ACQEU3_46885 [Spirillospora sp. CA-253888]